MKYVAIFKTQLLNNLAYSAELAVRSLSILIYLWIFVQLWRTTYAATGQQAIAGLTLADMLWYLMLAETIVLSKPRLSTAIAEAVKDGSIAYLLNKPYHFLLYQFSVGFGDSMLRLVLNLTFGGALVWWLVGPPPSPAGWPLVLISMLAAWLLDFTLNALIGLTAFITEEIAAFEWIYAKLVFILGGLLIPIDFFPPWLQAVSRALPFSATVYGPARLFVEPGLERFAALVISQLIWLGLLGLLLNFIYRRSIAWLSVNGG
jgi:ABC-2 type transport system permease protein